MKYWKSGNRRHIFLPIFQNKNQNASLTAMEDFLEQRIRERIEEGNLRTLTQNSSLKDFTSNDYLGFARSEKLGASIEKELDNYLGTHHGASGSRLLSGNSKYAEFLENFLEELFNYPVLIFNSGYNANIGVFSSIPQKQDTLILDEYIHASIIDGARLSGAKKEKFKHNDLENLEEILQKSTGNTFVGIESLYSMDGDFAPLTEMALLCQQYGAYLIVDEAHSTGIYGPDGKGRVAELGLEPLCFARIYTFGKALGTHGAMVVGSPLLKKYLINFARTFIYTTALPAHSMISILCAWKHRLQDQLEMDKLFQNIKFFEEAIPNKNQPLLRNQAMHYQKESSNFSEINTNKQSGTIREPSTNKESGTIREPDTNWGPFTNRTLSSMGEPDTKWEPVTNRKSNANIAPSAIEEFNTMVEFNSIGKREAPKDNALLSPIRSIIIPGNQEVKYFASQLRENGFDIRPILYPTVPKGQERIRICLHSFNEREEIKKLIEIISITEKRLNALPIE